MPGARSVKLEDPAAFVAVDRATFVLELVAVTATFGATAPLWSVTSTVMEPEVCASAATADKHHTITNRWIADRLRADAALARQVALRICTFNTARLDSTWLANGSVGIIQTSQTFANLSEHNMGRHHLSRTSLPMPDARI